MFRSEGAKNVHCLSSIDLVSMADNYLKQQLFSYLRNQDRMEQHHNMVLYILQQCHQILFVGKLPTLLNRMNIYQPVAMIQNSSNLCCEIKNQKFTILSLTTTKSKKKSYLKSRISGAIYRLVPTRGFVPASNCSFDFCITAKPKSAITHVPFSRTRIFFDFKSR